MKSVMIVIKPKWVEKIVSGKKTVEVRKSRPKLETPFKCYIYCTKDGGWLVSVNGKVNKPNTAQIDLKVDSVVTELNGAVIGEFVCDKIFNINYHEAYPEKYPTGLQSYFMVTDYNPECDTKPHYYHHCLSFEQLKKYLGEKTGYGWHISDLVIYDEPKELIDFVNYDKYQKCNEKGCFGSDCWICPNNATVTKPPQSWGYVESLD